MLKLRLFVYFEVSNTTNSQVTNAGCLKGRPLTDLLQRRGVRSVGDDIFPIRWISYPGDQEVIQQSALHLP
jgi:hypothetical protein